MHVTIRFRGTKRPDLGNHDYEDVLKSALARFQHRLRQVYLYVEDVNGPRGGVDLQCRCVLHSRGIPPIVIEDKDASVEALVHRVASRAAYVLSQKVDRQVRQSTRGRSRVEIDDPLLVPDLLLAPDVANDAV